MMVGDDACAPTVLYKTWPSLKISAELAITSTSVSQPLVSRALLRSGWQEEWAARPAAEMLLSLAHGLITGTDRPGADNYAEGDR